GMPDEVRGLVSRLTPWQVAAPGTRQMHLPAHDLVFGLGSAKLMQQHARRLGLWLTTTGHVRAWLAHTEFSALDFIRDSIRTTTHRGQAGAMLAALCLVKAPEVAPMMLEFALQSKTPAPAHRWLDEQPAHTVAGLVPIAAVKGKASGPAVKYLRAANCRGF